MILANTFDLNALSGRLAHISGPRTREALAPGQMRLREAAKAVRSNGSAWLVEEDADFL